MAGPAGALRERGASPRPNPAKEKKRCLGEQPAGLEGRGLGTRLRGGAKVRDGDRRVP